MEWEILAGVFALGSIIPTSSTGKPGSVTGVKDDVPGVPDALILLFG